MKICVHTATVQLDKHNKIIAASLEKGEILKAAKEAYESMIRDEAEADKCRASH